MSSFVSSKKCSSCNSNKNGNEELRKDWSREGVSSKCPKSQREVVVLGKGTNSNNNSTNSVNQQEDLQLRSNRTQPISSGSSSSLVSSLNSLVNC